MKMKWFAHYSNSSSPSPPSSWSSASSLYLLFPVGLWGYGRLVISFLIRQCYCSQYHYLWQCLGNASTLWQLCYVTVCFHMHSPKMSQKCSLESNKKLMRSEIIWIFSSVCCPLFCDMGKALHLPNLALFIRKMEHLGEIIADNSSSLKV